METRPGMAIGTPVTQTTKRPRKLKPAKDDSPPSMFRRVLTVLGRLSFIFFALVIGLILLFEFDALEGLGVPIAWCLMAASVLTRTRPSRISKDKKSRTRILAGSGLVLMVGSLCFYYASAADIRNDARTLRRQLFGDSYLREIQNAFEEPGSPAEASELTLKCVKALQGDHNSQSELMDMVKSQEPGFGMALATLMLLDKHKQPDEHFDFLRRGFSCGTPYVRLFGWDHIGSAKLQRSIARTQLERAQRARDLFLEEHDGRPWKTRKLDHSTIEDRLMWIGF